jgi:heme-degrading monooxygenase HmoA
MFMRFVRFKVKEGKHWDFAHFYEDRVIPAMQETDGCLFASLLQPSGEEDESVSMTMWRSRELAEEYEKSGLYDQLLDESDEFLAEASEWRVRLAGDPGGTVPPLQDPEIEAYPVEVAGFSNGADTFSSRGIYLRIVAARVEAGKFADLKERFNDEIKPELLKTKGCRAVFLVEGIEARSRALSVTVWDSEEDAVRYEMSGSFDELTAKVSEFFSGLYQWKLSLASEGEGETVSGKDLDVRGYQLVTGRRLGD